jgi:hypothetical protein
MKSRKHIETFDDRVLKGGQPLSIFQRIAMMILGIFCLGFGGMVWPTIGSMDINGLLLGFMGILMGALIVFNAIASPSKNSSSRERSHHRS